MSWQQEGWLVLADAGMPLFHGFFLTRWEADNKLKEVQALPEAELRYGATIVPAWLWFDWRGTPKVSSRMETPATPSASDAINQFAKNIIHDLNRRDTTVIDHASVETPAVLEHRCGVRGFDPMKDICPACSAGNR